MLSLIRWNSSCLVLFRTLTQSRPWRASLQMEKGFETTLTERFRISVASVQHLCCRHSRLGKNTARMWVGPHCTHFFHIKLKTKSQNVCDHVFDKIKQDLKNFSAGGADKVLNPTRKEISYSDRRFWVSYILFIMIIGGILVLFIYITRLASNEIFSGVLISP